MQNDFSFVIILEIIRKKFTHFLVFGLIAGVLAFVASMPQFITPLYKSEAIVYPSNIAPYSDESETEQLLQFFESNDIRNAVVAKFDLIRRYEIDSTSKSWRNSLILEYQDKVRIQKTRYEAVEISVMDMSPDTAKLIVQEIMEQVNLKIRSLHRAKSTEVVSMFERYVAEQKADLDSLETQLYVLRTEKGLLDYEKQTQEVTEGYMKMLANGRGGNALKKAETMLENLGTHGGELKRLVEISEFANEYYAEIYSSYQRAINDARKELTYINAVVSPEAPDKKAYPVRWLILFTAVFATELMLIVFFMVRGRFSK
ncbi:MAG: capsule polysaccharide export protein KpsE/RkpR [Sphingobacteriales bacterium]|jgi:capsule polysaccharide export protein KpsE/RkpR